MPAEFVAYGYSWLEHHPDWAMVTWTSPEQLQPLVNVDCLAYSRNLSQTSDILRYEILNRFGGVYLDTDFHCQKNIEPLLEEYEFVGAGEKPDMLSAGLIAAIPRHPIVSDVLAALPGRIRSNLHQAKSTGPGLLTEAWKPYKDHERVEAYGPDLFYPYAWNEPHRRTEKFPDAYAVHYWAGSWLGKNHA